MASDLRSWRQARDRQPVEAVGVKPGGFRHLVYGHHLVGVDGGLWTPVNSPPAIFGAAGAARQFTAASTQALTTPARGIDPLNLTMYALVKRRNTSGNHAILSAGAGSNDRVLLYLPNAAVAIFSGAGGTTGQASTTVSSYTDTANYVPIVARVSGSSYRDVSARFSDGSTITASNTTSASPAAPTVVAAGAYYNSGALTAGFYADADIAVAGVIPYAVSDRQLEDLLRNLNEWAQWLEPRSIWVPVSAGGAYTLTAEQGSYTLTGQAAGLLAGRVLAAAQGSYALTGQDVALLKGNTLAAAQGAYALTGQDVGLLRGLLLSAAQGSYALTGQDATITYTPLGAFSLTADQGSYTLTGQSVSLLWGHVLAAGQGSYTLNGQDATLTYTPVGAYILTAGQGSYALTGQDVLLQWGHVLAAAQGSYTITGQAATLARGLVLAAAQGSYTLTGQAAAFARTYVMSAGYGSYALTGQIVSLTYSGAALEALEYLLLISHITQSMSKTSKITMEVDLISRIQQQLDGSSSI